MMRFKYNHNVEFVIRMTATL